MEIECKCELCSKKEKKDPFLRDMLRLLLIVLTFLFVIGVYCFLLKSVPKKENVDYAEYQLERQAYEEAFDRLESLIVEGEYTMVLQDNGEVYFDNVDSFLKMKEVDYIVNDKKKIVYAKDLNQKDLNQEGDPQIIFGKDGDNQ